MSFLPMIRGDVCHLQTPGLGQLIEKGSLMYHNLVNDGKKIFLDLKEQILERIGDPELEHCWDPNNSEDICPSEWKEFVFVSNQEQMVEVILMSVLLETIACSGNISCHEYSSIDVDHLRQIISKTDLSMGSNIEIAKLIFQEYLRI